ncbi:uncharacterized protein LOC100678749 [Nasonia vitripennis]|uniref:Cardioactive peptide n=1 Tax=Nasonia vitripennis TaxID=7425 RepID=A0A7M7GBM0_NASVI|nr:uncharacterized protein LOC100678749 [Nasonia vitripennis]
MKVLKLVLSLLIIIESVEIARADDGLEIVAMKRPFCNAFTGCGRKRDPSYASGLQLPIPLYRALLRLSSLRNGAAAEVRMRQRPLGLIGPENLVQLGPQAPRLMAAPVVVPSLY